MRKSTNKELVEELKKLNVAHKLDAIIKKAEQNYYHDYKNPPGVTCGKTEFVNDSAKFHELKDLRQRVINGEFDEEADEDDKAMMRQDLPPHLWAEFGLNPNN